MDILHYSEEQRNVGIKYQTRSCVMKSHFTTEAQTLDLKTVPEQGQPLVPWLGATY